MNDVAGADRSDHPLVLYTVWKDTLTPSLIWTENPATQRQPHTHRSPLLGESEHPTQPHGPQGSMRSKDRQQQALLWGAAGLCTPLTNYSLLPFIQRL